VGLAAARGVGGQPQAGLLALHARGASSCVSAGGAPALRSHAISGRRGEGDSTLEIHAQSPTHATYPPPIVSF
jgi:hypothetical protein